MAHRVLPALVLAPLLLCGRADAGDPPAPASPPAPPAAKADAEGPAWPKQLSHRNARYASLARVDDPAGDLHVALLAQMNVDRVGDPTGDMEEVRVARASSKLPPRASADAMMARGRDASGDDGETVLAQGTFHRRFAETRRFRDIGGDKVELVKLQQDRQRKMWQREDNVIRTAGEHERPGALDSRTDQLESDAEREDQTRENREDVIGTRFDGDDPERDFGERGVDATELGTEGLLEGTLEDVTDATDERLDEKLLENQTEAQAERAEGGGTGSTAGVP